MKKVDEITLAVIANNMQWATEEMNTYLTKSAFSSNIKVRKDCSCALYDKHGNMIAQGTFIPVHLGIMSQTLKELLKLHPVETLSEGDALIHNNPFMMGSHLFDIMIFTPIFFEGHLIAFAGALAHHVDVGGNPISYISKTIYEEGVIIPGLKIREKGVMKEELVTLIATNLRTPYEFRGDLMAQLAACTRGEIRITALAEKYGREALEDYFDALLDYSENGIRASIRALPNGTHTFADTIQTDGDEIKDTVIRATVTIEDEDIIVDFDGSDAPVTYGFNCQSAATHSAVYYSVKAVLGADVPTNTGAYRAIHIKYPDYPTIVNAQPPHAIAGCNCIPSQRICDVVIGAFAELLPERVCACDGHWNAITLIGNDERTGRNFSYVETYGAGRGAKYNEDGANAHQTHMTNTANAPTEIIELEYPFRVEQYALRPNTGGAGKYRGGLGIIRELSLLTDTSVSIITGRPFRGPYGLKGGGYGKTDIATVERPGEEKEQRLSGCAVQAGTKVVITTSGGGGFGNANERALEAINWDLKNGYITADVAEKEYDVKVGQDLIAYR